MKDEKKIKTGIGLTIVILSGAILLFVPLFITGGLTYFDFWWWMSSAILTLLIAVFILDREYRNDLLYDFKTDRTKKILIGLLSAVILYGVFFAGNIISRKIFTFAGSEIAGIYGFKSGASILRITLLMTLIIGPGEELFWRGFLQRRLQSHLGGVKGYIIATIVYAAVHTGSGNPMLVLAALVCGLFWGWLYLRYRSLLLNVVSHTVWDLVVFLILPYNQQIYI